MPDFEIMLKKWNIWNCNILVNMSELSDMELLDLKKAAEEEINTYSVNKKQEMWQFFMEFGLGLTLRRLLYYVLRKIGYKKDNLTKSFQDLERQTKGWHEILEG